MPQVVTGKIIKNTLFSFPWRMVLSGSSGSGKTYFANMLLARQDLFQEHVKSVLYCYPCYMDVAPVKWHKTLRIPVSYNIGLPSKKELLNLPPNTCVVLDDLYSESIKNEDIDHLFRVISGKKKICVMVMTQNNFTQGRYGRDIRNSCNFCVLFRNCCDTNINKRVTSMSGLQKAYNAATKDQAGIMYPYIFIDQSQRGQVSGYKLYSDIFGRFQTVWSDTGMKGYVIGEIDFLSTFSTTEKSEEFAAIKNDNAEYKARKLATFQPAEPEELTFTTDSSSSEDECTPKKTISHDDEQESLDKQKVCADEHETEQGYPNSEQDCEQPATCSTGDAYCGTGRKANTRRRIRSRHRKRFRASVYGH